MGNFGSYETISGENGTVKSKHIKSEDDGEYGTMVINDQNGNLKYVNRKAIDSKALKDHETRDKYHGIFNLRWLKHVFGRDAIDNDVSEMRIAKWLHFTSFCLFLLSSIALFVLVGIGEFDVKTDFETDFITDKTSPRPTNAKLFIVGTPKTGWFVAPIFLFNALVHLLVLRDISAKDDRGHDYRTQLGKLYDMGIFWRYLGLSFLSVVVGATIGVMNVFVFILLFVCIFGLGVKFHHEIPRLARNALHNLITILELKPGKRRNTTNEEPTEVEVEKKIVDDNFISVQTPNESANVVQTHALMNENAKQFISNKIKFFSKNFGSGKTWGRISHAYSSIIKNLYAGISTHFYAAALWMIAFATFMSYYVSALVSDHSTFSWWVHVSFWCYQIAIFLSVFFSLSFWGEMWTSKQIHQKRNASYDSQNDFNFWDYILTQYFILTVFELLVGWFSIAGSNDNYGRLY